MPRLEGSRARGARPTTTIRVPVAIRDRLQALANERHEPVGVIIGELLEEYERSRFFARVADDFARLRADRAESDAYDNEVAAWDATLADGLEAEPWDEA